MNTNSLTTTGHWWHYNSLSQKSIVYPSLAEHTDLTLHILIFFLSKKSCYLISRVFNSFTPCLLNILNSVIYSIY